MKRLLTVLAVFALVFAGCEDGTTEDGNGGNTQIKTSLGISNHSSYGLFNVEYSSVSFGDLNVGANKTMDVNADSPNPIYFDLNIINNRIRCKTNEVIIIDEGNAEERAISNNTVISTVEGGVTGTLNVVFNTLSKPIMELSQNNEVIGNDAPLPFDFGRVELSGNKQMIFTIKNLGNLPLELTGTPLISSSNAVFSIPSQPTTTSIIPGASVSFLVRYSPTAERDDTGTITIYNNSDDLVFNLNVKGAGYIPFPQITINQSTVSVNPFGEYDFGNIELGRTSDVTFTIGNSGDANLNFVTVDGNRINLSDNGSNVFSVIQQPSSTTAVIPGGTTTFILRFIPNMAENIFTATVRIKTNSRDNDDFSFTVKGGSYEVEPAAPTGVTAVAQSVSSIRVSWNPVPGATSYRVYYGTSSLSITILVNSTITDTFYEHTGLAANTTYHYRVVAVNGAGDSDYSSSVSATTRINSPTGVSATAQSTSSISVSWNPLSGATSYKVYYTTGNSSGAKILAGTVTTTPYTHTGLQAGITYYYFVVAISGSDESDYSNYSSTVVLPTVPTGVNATTQSTSSISVSWNPVTGATSYKVYYTTGSSSGSKIQAGTASGTSYTHNGLQGGTTYYYFIIAVNTSGESDYSSSSSATTQISAPTGVTAAGQSTSSIRVSWNSVTGATNYRIYYSDTQDGPKTLLTTTSGTSYTHTGLQAAKGYYYFIQAINNSGSESGYSSYAYGYSNFT